MARYLWPVVVRDDSEPKPKLLALGQGLHDILVSQASNFDWDHGFDFRISNDKGHYSIELVENSSPAGTPEQMKAWKEQITTLTAPFGYEELR
jgi:hypothetical protein